MKPFAQTLALVAALTFLLASAPPAPAEEKPAVAAEAPVEKIYAPGDLEALKEQKGKPVVVEGTVAAQGESKSGGVRYLNFSKNFKQTISLVFILSTGGDAFAKEKLAEYVGKKVRVTGVVETYNDALQIKIQKLDQIQVQP